MMRLCGSLLFCAFVACRPADGSTATTTEAAVPVHVHVAAVVTQPMPEYVTLTGTLRGNQESDVAADASGKVMQTLVERGQLVKRGQVMVTLDARGAALGANVAEAQSKVAQSQLEEAQRECARVKNLLETKVISQAEYDRQTADCTAKQWSATAAQAQSQTAVKLLGDTRVRAPFDGVVGERFVDVGQYVSPSTKVASVYEQSPLRLQLTVPESDLGFVKMDMHVIFSVAAFPDENFEGVVKFISPNVREATRDMVVEAIVANEAGKLKPGMFAVAKVALGDQPHTVVPNAALLKDETGARGFVVVSGQIQERVLQLGSTKGDEVAILSGVKDGESIILSPTPDVHDGAKAIVDQGK
ncbi:MAG TPA: efflux RND transporter periplasmic adaptor subunit [Polyangiaceae bacterium]|jgi:RND family efflux transporter MFP subunit